MLHHPLTGLLGEDGLAAAELLDAKIAYGIQIQMPG